MRVLRNFYASVQNRKSKKFMTGNPAKAYLLRLAKPLAKVGDALLLRVTEGMPLTHIRGEEYKVYVPATK